MRHGKTDEADRAAESRYRAGQQRRREKQQTARTPYAFLNLPKKYPEAFARSEMKVSEGTVKILGYGSIILSAIFSASLIIELPTAAKIGFVILFAASIAWANSGKLDKIEIPNDLDVQYVK